MLNFTANTDTHDDTKATHIHTQIDHSTFSACAGLTLLANINCNFVIARVSHSLITCEQVFSIYKFTALQLTLRRLMSHTYIYIYMEHPFLMFLYHTQRRSTVGRTPLDE